MDLQTSKGPQLFVLVHNLKDLGDAYLKLYEHRFHDGMDNKAAVCLSV